MKNFPFTKTSLLALGLSCIFFISIFWGWHTITKYKAFTLFPLQEKISLLQDDISSATQLLSFKQKKGDVAMDVLKRSMSYASSKEIEKIKFESYLVKLAQKINLYYFTFHIGSDSSLEKLNNAFLINKILLEFHIQTPNPSSILKFIISLYEGPYFLYASKILIIKKTAELFEGNINMEWLFPEYENKESLYTFLTNLGVSPSGNLSLFEKEEKIFLSFFKEPTSLKKESTPSPQLIGIMYSDPKKWVIWLNSTPLTPTYNPTSFTIISVNPKNVLLNTSTGPLLLSL